MYTILIVDDEKNERSGIERLIRKYEYPLKVLQADSGESALEVFKKSKIDILLTDIKMPFMTGIELIRAVHVEGYQPVCIIYSAYGEFEYAKSAIALGVIEYLLKPVKLQEFVFPRHKRILERFRLNCYGCCEAYDPRWKYVKQLPNLRRVSVSPWSDWTTVPELLGRNYIASVKLKPTALASSSMNEDVVRSDCRRAAEQTKGGICEFIMKDNHTLGNQPYNAVRWVEIMREEIDRVYS